MYCKRQITQKTDQLGIALLSVLWVISILTVLAASVAASQRQETSATSLWLKQTQARHAAEGAINLAVYQLLTRQIQPGSETEQLELEVAEQSFYINMSSEAGKADINQVTEPVLRKLISSLSIDEQTALSLTDAILDWRDGDELVRLNGAEKRDYLHASHPYMPSNGPFRDISELQRVIGMTPAIYLQLEPLITVYSGQSSIDLAAAGPKVLKALGQESSTQRQFLSASSSRLLNITVSSLNSEQANLELQTIVALRPGNVIEPFNYLSWKYAVPGVSEMAEALFSEQGGIYNERN